MPTSEICNLNASEMVQMISRKEVSAREIMEAHLTQIDRVNPKVNALVTLCPELALEGSDLADKHIENKKKFRDAVKDGLIDKTANPYYLQKYKELTLNEFANTFSDRVLKKYQ